MLSEIEQATVNYSMCLPISADHMEPSVESCTNELQGADQPSGYAEAALITPRNRLRTKYNATPDRPCPFPS